MLRRLKQEGHGFKDGQPELYSKTLFQTKRMKGRRKEKDSEEKGNGREGERKKERKGRRKEVEK